MLVTFTDDFGYSIPAIEMSKEEMERRNQEIDNQGLDEYGFWHPVNKK